MDAKTALRARVRDARHALSHAYRERSSAEACARAAALPEVAAARAVLAYVATAEELDPAPLLAALRARGARVALPRVDRPGVLDLHWAEEDAALEPGPFGILEPSPQAPRASLEEIDVVIVPGVAFDAEGGRLGYGGGFYDRLLAALPPATAAVGIAFDEQVLEALPAEPHDRPVAVLVTPSTVYRRG